jgi:hypothetical protein
VGVLIDSTDNPETDYPVCPICSRPCDDKPTSVACDICNSWLHYECENITPEEETKLDDPGTNYICILCNYQHDTMIGKEGAIQSISYHSSQKGDTDNNKTDRPTPHFRAQHILSRPQQVEKQTTQPSSQSIKTHTVNRDIVLSPNRVNLPKQPYHSISSCSILCVAIIFDLCNSLFSPLMLSSMIYSWITAF